MANINCIPLSIVNEFKARLKNKKITPEKLMDMTSEERHAYFKDFMGEDNALKVNALFESKLMLKNVKKGIITWAKNVSGMTPQAKTDLVSKVERMEKILKPEQQKEFYADLAAQKLGTKVTEAEAAKIVDMAADVKKLETKMNPDYTFNSEAERLEYGLAKVDFLQYVNDLKHSVKKPLTPFRAFTSLAGITKSLKATFDNSVIGRQGLKVLFSHPKVWLKNSLRTYQDAFKTFKGEDVMRAIKADIYSRPNALNGLYNREKLAVGVREEAFPTSAPEKIPILGRAFKASEAAFLGFQYRTRADVFDKYVEIAQRSGADITGVGNLVNVLTGRSNLGRVEPVADVVNSLFFSPRFLKSHIDFLGAHALDPKMGKFAKQQAMWNLGRTIAGIGSILGIAQMLDPESVEWDPRSSNFGKIKVGNTRFDVTGGMASLVTLASRILTWSSKSSTTGISTKLNEPGGMSGKEMLYNFGESKTSPMLSLAIHIAEGETFNGKPMTLGRAFEDLVVPMPATNYEELSSDPNSAPLIASLIADFHGIGSNTYSPARDWETSKSAQMKAFKQKVGPERFKEASQENDVAYTAYVHKTVKDPKFWDLDTQKKLALLRKNKERIKNKIFLKYGFSPSRKK